MELIIFRGTHPHPHENIPTGTHLEELAEVEG